MDFAVIAEHPNQPGLMIGIGLPAMRDHDLATDLAFSMMTTYRFLGAAVPGDEGTDYLFVYRFKGMRMAAITAGSLEEAADCMEALAAAGELISSSAHTS